MSSDRHRISPATPTEGASAFAILGTDFLEILALFVRTIPLYPDGHGRVVAVSDRLEDTAAALSEPVVIEVADRGLIVSGVARPELSPGPKALREALLATAVVRVVIQPSTPASSYVTFARTLQRNARVAGAAHLSFADLWMSPVPGIELFELVFGVEGFAAAADPANKASGTIEVLGSVAGDGSGIGAGGVVAGSTGLAGGEGVDDATHSEPKPPSASLPDRARGMHTVSRDLRALALEDSELRAGLADVEDRLVIRGATEAASGADVLEHLVRALPIEARLDPEKGLRALRRIIDQLRTKLLDEPPPTGRVELSTRFAATLHRVFPRRVDPVDEVANAPPDDIVTTPTESFTFDELAFLDDSLLDGLHGGPQSGPAPVPELSGEDGLVDPTGMLLHALLEEPKGDRRDDLRRRLLEGYKARSKHAAPPCLLTHLSEAIAVPPASRDTERLTLLASIADEARIEFRADRSPLTVEVEIAIFPLCFVTYLRSGGRAGAIARKVGRDAVLAVAAKLVEPYGALTGDSLDRVLAERSYDVLPFVEALLVGAPSMRSRVVRALRALDLKSLAAVALRVVPDDRFSDRFLRGLCTDGFAGIDSKHLVPEAAAALGSVVVDKEGVLDLKTRIYATAALGSFPAELAESSLRAVVARKLIGAAPKEIRRAAEDVLERFARAAAYARPVP